MKEKEETQRIITYKEIANNRHITMNERTQIGERIIWIKTKTEGTTTHMKNNKTKM